MPFINNPAESQQIPVTIGANVKQWLGTNVRPAPDGRIETRADIKWWNGATIPNLVNHRVPSQANVDTWRTHDLADPVNGKIQAVADLATWLGVAPKALSHGYVPTTPRQVLSGDEVYNTGGGHSLGVNPIPNPVANSFGAWLQIPYNVPDDFIIVACYLEWTGAPGGGTIYFDVELGIGESGSQTTLTSLPSRRFLISDDRQQSGTNYLAYPILLLNNTKLWCRVSSDKNSSSSRLAVNLSIVRPKYITHITQAPPAWAIYSDKRKPLLKRLLRR